MRRLLFVLLVLMSAPLHAAWLQLCPATQVADATLQASAETVGAAGHRLRWVAAQTQLPGCEALPLPPGARVETLFPLASADTVERTILLHGSRKDGRFAVSEHVLPSSKPGAPPPGPMPLHANLLANMQARPFGVEERVRVTLAKGRLDVECAAGKRAAGVLLTGPWYLPQARAALAAAYAGGAGFSLQVADARSAAQETALDLGELAAGMQREARFGLPERLERGSWRQFILLCPGQAASLAIDSLRLEPVPSADGVKAPRATWVWGAADWRERAPALLAWAASTDVRELFVTVPFKDGKVAEPGKLGAFIRAAGKQGVKVLSVDGDPHMVLPDHQASLARMARAYAAYNAGVAQDARLAGLQFDVEPYLLPEYGAGPADWDARYLAMARTLREAAGSLRLELVLPFWWDGKRELLASLAPLVDALVVMDYRTDPEQITGFALPFLDWGARHGKQVRIALEAGPIAPETQRRYVRLDPGEGKADLLHLRLGGKQVLALLREPVALTDAMRTPDAFRLQGSREIDGSATTFHRDKAALLQMLPRLEADFSAWGPAFRGIALHELR